MIAEDVVYQKLHEVFADVFFRDDIKLSPDLTAKDVEGWDSYRQIEIVMATEEYFKFKFTSSELDNMRRLADLVRPVVQRGSSPSGK